MSRVAVIYSLFVQEDNKETESEQKEEEKKVVEPSEPAEPAAAETERPAEEPSKAPAASEDKKDE